MGTLSGYPLCRCVEHIIHLTAHHFVNGVGIPSSHAIKQKIHTGAANDFYGIDEFDENFDVDLSTEIEASAEDVDAMLDAAITDFAVGDVVGKLMAFVAQLRLSSEDTRDFLLQLCAKNNCPTWEIRLWVRTRWGSLSDCFCIVLAQQKVQPLIPLCLSILSGLS
jgi:hypothetical protein